MKSAEEVAATLGDVVEELSCMDDDDFIAIGMMAGSEFQNCEVGSFKAEGVLTNDAGFVLKTEDGQEFQVTVVRSK